MIQPSVITDTVRRPFIAAAAASLIDVFEIGFDLWTPDTAGWQRIAWDSTRSSTSTDCEVPVEDVQSVLNDGSRDLRRPQMVQREDNHYLLIVPLVQDGRVGMIATGVARTREPRTLLRLARMFVREFERGEDHARLRDENVAYAQQVTEDFEELVFLRQMAEHLEVSEASKDLVEMADSILPLLIQSIKAETLVVITANAPDEDSQTAECPVGRPILWQGLHQVDDEICRQLVRRFRRDAELQAVVRNRFDRCEDGRDIPGVRGFVLVAMSKGDTTNGWLLAINRSAGYDYGQRDDLWQLSDLEFGTGEASLLSSAATMLATHARNVELFREKENLLIDVVRAMVSTVEAKDEYTCGHSERVALFGRRLGQELGLDEEECDRLYLTGVLHDVGKIAISDATLTKPSRLSETEFEEIKQHPDRGWMILHGLEQLRYVLPGVLYHHERWDGKGYPDGLEGENIPLHGRILAVADAYDAMTSDRPYRKGMPQEKAEAILREGAGTQWDAQVVEAYFRASKDILRIRESYQRRLPPQRMRGQSSNSAEPGPENGGPENGGPENGGPENGGPENGGPENGGPENGGPQSGRPENGPELTA